MMENNATTKEDTSTASASAQGIWKATLGEKEIIMAVNQSAQSVFGLAKFEGDNPWNAAIAGSLSANAVSFSLAAMEGEVLASIYISATLEGDSMNGIFHPIGQQRKSQPGRFHRYHDQPGYIQLHPSRGHNCSFAGSPDGASEH